MTIDIQCFEEYGAPTSGRGTSIDLGDITTNPELGNWNLKLSPNPLVPYYPTQDSSGFALVRPARPGDLVLSYKKYLYFKVSGSYAAKLKDIRLELGPASHSLPTEPTAPSIADYGGAGGGAQYASDYAAYIEDKAKFEVDKEDAESRIENKGAQAQKSLLFYKQTNVYAQPDQAFDGKMIYTANANPALTIHPFLGTSPTLAMSRGIVYGPNETFYTNYIVLQMAAQHSTWEDVGNTAEFQLRLYFKEFM